MDKKTIAGQVRKGDLVRIVKMDDAGGSDWQAASLAGFTGVVEWIDDAGQIHLRGTGLALIPGLDEYEVLNDKGNGNGNEN